MISAINQKHGSNEGLSTKPDVGTIWRKKWILKHGKIVPQEGKYVISKRDIFQTLSQAHTAIAHGEETRQNDISESYTEISEVISLFVSMCTLHQQQHSITDHVKKPILQALMPEGFLSNVEIDLINFRKLPCSCNPKHNWVLHISDHFSKFSWLYPLQSEETEHVI